MNSKKLLLVLCVVSCVTINVKAADRFAMQRQHQLDAPWIAFVARLQVIAREEGSVSGNILAIMGGMIGLLYFVHLN